MSISEEQLARWAKAPSETEEGKCQNAVSRITEALQTRFGYAVSIFLQGSYRNRTNVRLDSDVDIVVRHNGFYFPGVEALSATDKKIYWDNFKASGYTFFQFKNEVQQALENKFSSGEIERKDKCINVKGNSQRVNTDVVPCFVYNRLNGLASIEAKGIKFRVLTRTEDFLCTFLVG